MVCLGCLFYQGTWTVVRQATTRGVLIQGLQEHITQGIDGAVRDLHAHPTLRELYSHFGITPPPEYDPAPISDYTPTTSSSLLMQAYASQVAEPARLAGHLDGLRQSPIGRPGTPILAGVVQQEQNFRLLPFHVHGSNGEPGIYEEVYRTDSGAFKHTNELATLFQSAVYEPQLPEGEENNKRLEGVMKSAHAAVKRCNWADVKENASTVIRHGHAPFEVCWERRADKGFLPYRLTFIEQSAVKGLVLDSRGIDVLGVKFEAWSTDSSQAARHWELPVGNTPETARCIFVRYNSTGLNWLGVSPYRPATGLRKLKELVLECAGIGFQRFGIPILLLMHDLAAGIAASVAQIGDTKHKGEIEKTLKRLDRARARFGSAIPVPAGMTVTSLAPQGEMPDYVPFLQYLDYAIALCFSNEGAMLGTGSGSYALAQSKENAFLRSAPAYTRSFTRSLDQLMRWCVMFNYPGWEELEAFPEYTSRFPGTQNASAWTEDMVKLMDKKVWEWPALARHMAAANMGLPPNVFDDEEFVRAMTPEPAPSPSFAPVSEEDDEEEPIELEEVA